MIDKKLLNEVIDTIDIMLNDISDKSSKEYLTLGKIYTELNKLGSNVNKEVK